MEETYALRRSYSDVMPEEDSKSGRSRNGSIGRRSFFKRRSGRHQHQRSGSKDSRELTSFSDLSMNSDNVPIADDGAPLLYQRVEKIHCKSDCRLCMHTVQPDLIYVWIFTYVRSQFSRVQAAKWLEVPQYCIIGDIWGKIPTVGFKAIASVHMCFGLPSSVCHQLMFPHIYDMSPYSRRKKYCRVAAHN